MDMFVNILLFIITILCIIYGYYKHVHSYWDKIGVPFIEGKIPCGSITSVILKRQTFTDKISEIYNTMKNKGHKYVGIYFFTRKALLIIDPDMIKTILISDFQYFSDRGIYYDETNDPLSAHLVALSGDAWKELRQKLSPTFSSGKLKFMFDAVLQCATELINVLNDDTINQEVEFKDFAARYTTDVIGSCAFGIECNSLRNSEAEFRQIGRRVFKQKYSDVFKRLIIRNSPRLAKILKLKVINEEVSKFFIRAVTETVGYRKLNNISRGDFMQLLIGLMAQKANGKDSGEKNSSDGLTINQVAAQAFVFFLAGFETSASTITFALYELAMHPDIQEKVRQEIGLILKKHDNNITYDAIIGLQYMEKVLLETMRKYPTFVMLMRKCTRDYKLPGGNVTLAKGIPVIIPVYALHHDPTYYPEPERFDPERFDADAIKSKTDQTYLPFGSGPRICIGLRFAMIQMKVAITSLLLNFKFTLNRKTNVPLIMNPSSFILTPTGGTWLNITRIPSNETQ